MYGRREASREDLSWICSVDCMEEGGERLSWWIDFPFGFVRLFVCLVALAIEI